MQTSYQDPLTRGSLVLTVAEPRFEHTFFSDHVKPVLTIAWNRGSDTLLHMDGEVHVFPAGHVAPLVVNQTFAFPQADKIVFWQFDKPFYCIEDYDAEVSCIGFLFWGHKGLLTIKLAKEEEHLLELWLQMFMRELQTKDNIQAEMLRALLKRLIVALNQIAKTQHIGSELKPTDLDLVRQFNVLVEKHFRQIHQVQAYADMLHKSPKTLANIFSLYHEQTPLEVIHTRILLEAKRLLLYTDKAVKEIAFELNFEDVSHFGRFFKRGTGNAPGEWKIQVRQQVHLAEN